jgi:hypothetical protein
MRKNVEGMLTIWSLSDQILAAFSYIKRLFGEVLKSVMSV